MTSGSFDLQDDDPGRRELERHGFLHVERSLYNLRMLSEGLGLEPRFLLKKSLETPDPDLALNGLERLLLRIPEASDRLTLKHPIVLERALRMAGSSEQLVEGLSEFLEDLADPGFGAIPESGPDGESVTSPKELLHWHRREITRICLADLEGSRGVEETARALSQLADRTAEVALRLVSDEPVEFAVIALGKWGGMELNYSSDLDFFFLRADDSDARTCEIQARRFLKLLGGIAGEHLYRTDLRLRPGGPTAPLVPSEAQARHELRASGGTWERLIHIRVHAAAGNTGVARLYLQDLARFVYESPFHLEEIRQVKNYKDLLERTVDDELEHQELKIGWGGIRDVEYIVQFLQLLHGAIYPSIRGGNVFDAIRGLGRVGALTTTERAYLLGGYRFLRRVEHHLMLRHRRQSFLLPEAKDARRALARGLGFNSWLEFRAEFDRRRDRIREIFDRLFGLVFTGAEESSTREVNFVLAFRPEKDEIERVLAPLHFRDPQKAYTLLRRLAYPRRRALQSPRTRHFLAHLFPRLLARLRLCPDPDQAVLMFTRCVETLGAPGTFYQLLAERPENCALFVDLFGSSRFLSDLLLDHPGILDELMDRLRTGERIDEESLTLDLQAALLEKDPRSHSRILHEFRALHLLEIAVLDLSGRIPLTGVLLRLSAVARALLRSIDADVLRRTEERLGTLDSPAGATPPRHAILALGRLGGDEMGYASDIDLVLVYDGTGVTADGVGENEFYTQHLQQVISTLANPGTGGALYSVDLRLRPYGRGGTLVHSFRNFRDYFTSEASQVWEHQALVRSSFAAGDPALGAEILGFIRDSIGRGLESATILDEMTAMHRRRAEEDSRATGFPLKTGPGGILDIEFLVQSAILLNHRDDPEVWEPNTPQALHLLERKGILSGAETAALTTAYQFLRLVENRLSMLHRASVRVVPTDDSSLQDLARRIGYESVPGAAPEKTMLEEIRYHTQKVRQIFERHTRSDTDDGHG